MHNLANDKAWYYIVNQWDVKGMSNKHAACAVHSRHAHIVVPSFDANKSTLSLSSHRFPLITGEFCTYCVWVFL